MLGLVILASCLLLTNALDWWKGHEAMKEQPPILEGGNRYKHDVEVVDRHGGKTTLRYDVEVAPEVLSLDSLAGLIGVECRSDQGINLQFSSDESLRAAQERIVIGTKLVGSHEWQCESPVHDAADEHHDVTETRYDEMQREHEAQVAKDGVPTVDLPSNHIQNNINDYQNDLKKTHKAPIYSMVQKIGMIYEDAHILTFDAAPFHFHQAFSEGEVYFKTTPGKNHKNGGRPFVPHNGEMEERKRKTYFPFQVDEHWQEDVFNFNYDKISKQAIAKNVTVFPNFFGLKLTCVECYSYLHVELEFHMVVTREPWSAPRLESLRVYFSGEFGLHLALLWTMSYEFGFQVFSKKLIPDIDLMPPILFTVGPIPILIVNSIGLKLNVGLRVRGDIRIGHGFSTTQKLGMGVQYVRGAGGPQFIGHAGPELDFFKVTGEVMDPSRTAIGVTLVPAVKAKLWKVIPVTLAPKPMVGLAFNFDRCPKGKVYYTAVSKLDIDVGLASLSLDIPGTPFSFDLALEGGLPFTLTVTPILIRDLTCEVCSGCIGLRSQAGGPDAPLDLTASIVPNPVQKIDVALECAKLSTCTGCNADAGCRWCQSLSQNRVADAGTCVPLLSGAGVLIPANTAACAPRTECVKPLAVDEVVYPLPGTIVAPGGRLALKWHGNAVGQVELRYTKLAQSGAGGRKRAVLAPDDKTCQLAPTCKACASLGCNWCANGQQCTADAERCRLAGVVAIVKDEKECPRCDGASCSRCLAEDGCAWCGGEGGAEFCALETSGLAKTCGTNGIALQKDALTCDDADSAVAAALKFQCANYFSCDRCRADSRCNWCGTCVSQAAAATKPCADPCPPAVAPAPAVDPSAVWFAGAGLPEAPMSNDLRYTWFVPTSLDPGAYQLLVVDATETVDYAVSQIITVEQTSWQADPFPPCPNNCQTGAAPTTLTRSIKCVSKSGQQLSPNACRRDEQPASETTCTPGPCSACPAGCEARASELRCGFAPGAARATCGAWSSTGALELDCRGCCSRDCACEAARWHVFAAGECATDCSGQRSLARVGCFHLNPALPVPSVAQLPEECPVDACPARSVAVPGFDANTMTQDCQAPGVCQSLQLTVTEWDECTDECGGGTQSRRFECRKQDARGSVVVDTQLCLDANLGVELEREADGSTEVRRFTTLAELPTLRSCNQQVCPLSLLSARLGSDATVVVPQAQQTMSANSQLLGVAAAAASMPIAWTGGQKKEDVVIEYLDSAGGVTSGSQKECIDGAKWVEVATLPDAPPRTVVAQQTPTEEPLVGREYFWIPPPNVVAQRTRLRVRMKNMAQIRATTEPFSISKGVVYSLDTVDGSSAVPQKGDSVLLYGSLANSVVQVGAQGQQAWVGERVRGVTLLPGSEGFARDSVFQPGAQLVVKQDGQPQLLLELPAEGDLWTDARSSGSLLLPCESSASAGASQRCAADVKFAELPQSCADLYDPDLSLLQGNEGDLQSMRVTLPPNSSGCNPPAKRCDGQVVKVVPPSCACPGEDTAAPAIVLSSLIVVSMVASLLL